MSTNFYQISKPARKTAAPAFIVVCSFLLLLSCLVQPETVFGRTLNIPDQDTSAEKKVDYLQRIYFSGETKAGLNTKILVALQELSERPPTQLLARQVTYLLEIKDKAIDAEDACDILEMLAVGIYNIDAVEAEKQGVKYPSSKARAKTVDAIGTLNQLNSNSRNISTSASEAAWSSYLLSGGKSTGFISSASKVAATAGRVEAATGAIAQAAQTGKQLKDLGQSFGLMNKKDKACNDVPKKVIEIGPHINPNANALASAGTTPVQGASAQQSAPAQSSPVQQPAAVQNTPGVTSTVINIPGVNAADLKLLTDALKLKDGVEAATRTFSSASSTITVKHSGSTEGLADWISEKFDKKFDLAEFNAGKIGLIVKAAKK